MKKFLVVLFAFLSLSGADALAAIENCPECRAFVSPQPLVNLPAALNLAQGEPLPASQQLKPQPIKISQGAFATPGAQSLEVNWAPGQPLPGAFDPSQFDPTFRIPGPQFQLNQPLVMAPQVPFMNPMVPFFLPPMMMR
jgi:hypothetical protein